MTDLEFKEFMRRKALERRKKIFEVRAKEKEARKAIEENYKTLINLLKNFREYTFIVIRRNKSFPITVYSDTPFQIVKELIDEVETHYMTTGELLYKLYTSVK
jgi:hypothetical protein